MPNYVSPGVYVEEISAGPPPIEGVPTGVATFLGETEHGPTTPRLLSCHGEFERIFGCASDRGSFLPHAVKGYFDNGGRRLWVCRVAGRNASHAERDFGNFQALAAGPGEWGRRVMAR